MQLCTTIRKYNKIPLHKGGYFLPHLDCSADVIRVILSKKYCLLARKSNVVMDIGNN